MSRRKKNKKYDFFVLDDITKLRIHEDTTIHFQFAILLVLHIRTKYLELDVVDLIWLVTLSLESFKKIN